MISNFLEAINWKTNSLDLSIGIHLSRAKSDKKPEIKSPEIAPKKEEPIVIAEKKKDQPKVDKPQSEINIEMELLAEFKDGEVKQLEEVKTVLEEFTDQSLQPLLPYVFLMRTVTRSQVDISCIATKHLGHLKNQTYIKTL